VDVATFQLRGEQTGKRPEYCFNPRSTVEVLRQPSARLMQYNRSEFHHVYPRAFLKETAVPDDRINCLANFCLLTSAENKKISGKRPSKYFSDLVHGPGSDDVLKSAFLEKEDFNDDFQGFIERRAKKLLALAGTLLEIDVPQMTHVWGNLRITFGEPP
jgi:hypothetical protein